MNFTPKQATLIGYLSLLLWALSATLLCEVRRIPFWQYNSYAMTLGFTVSCFLICKNQRWKQIGKAGWSILIVIALIGINQVAYVSAFRLAPAENAELIAYLWPLFVILFSGFLRTETRSKAQLLGALISFIGLNFLLGHAGDDWFQNAQHMEGYFYALVAAAVWAVYVLYSRARSALPKEVVGIAMGVLALFSFATHMATETYVPPTAWEWTVMTTIGIGSYGCAYMMWDVGVRHGHFKLLTLLSYGNPIIAIVFLSSAGHTQPTWSLAIASLLVTFGIAFPSIYKRAVPTSSEAEEAAG